MPLRASLAALMRGDLPPVGGEAPVDAWLRAAQAEGVTALIHARLQDPRLGAALHPEHHAAFARTAREQLARSLVLEAETRRVLRQLEEAALPVLVIKGTALAHWLYPASHLRERADVDLLFPSREEAVRAAERVCEADYEWPGLAVDLARCEATCYRRPSAGPPLELDLHWDIGGGPIYERRFAFAELWEGSQLLPALEARSLGPVHALVHAALHRALQCWRGDGERLKWLWDFHLLAPRLDAPAWEALLAICQDRGLCGTCLDALQAAARNFGTPLPASPLEALARGARGERIDMGRMHRWSYVQRMNLRALPTLGLRLRWLRERLVPSAAYLRHHHGGRGGTAGAFLRYLGQGLRNLGI